MFIKDVCLLLYANNKLSVLYTQYWDYPGFPLSTTKDQNQSYIKFYI